MNCLPLKKFLLFNFDWGFPKFLWAKLRIRCSTSGKNGTDIGNTELWKGTCDVSSIFALVSLFLCLTAFLNKRDTAISISIPNVLELALRTVFFHTVVVNVILSCSEKVKTHKPGSKTKAAVSQTSYFHPCTHCSDCNMLISKQYTRYTKEADSLILGPKPNGYIQSHVPQGTVTEFGSFVIF